MICFFFLSSPCFAHFTHDIMSYTMSSYLYDRLEEREKRWASQQAEHLHAFQEQKGQEIRLALKKAQDRLNQLPKFLQDQRESLNASIGRYHDLLSQWEIAEQEKQGIQEEINKIIQKIQEQETLTEKVVRLGEEVNAFVRMVNKNINQLTYLEAQERDLRNFYNNKKYLQDVSIVDFKIDWDKWKQSQDREYEAQATSYNNKVEESKIWQQDQRRSIEDQETQARMKQKELDTLVQTINTLISEYNGEIKKGCKTKECEQGLLSKKKHIVEEEQRIEAEKQIITHLISAINEQRRSYNEEIQRRTRELDALKQNTEAISLRVSEEYTRWEQEWVNKIQIQKEKAKENWRKSQQQLNQFRAILKANYGDNFSQFVERLSHWSNINQTAFTNLGTQSLSQQDGERMQASNNTLCESHPDWLPAQVKAICELTQRIAHLLSHISYFDVVLNERREQLKQKEKEVADLKKRLSRLNAVNNQRRSEWDTQLQQHNEKLPEREAQYDRFSEQLWTQLNEQIQQIWEAYNKKRQLLIAEYDLISYLLFMPSNRPSDDEGVNKKQADFESARQAFLSSIPQDVTSFSPEFMETHELLLYRSSMNPRFHGDMFANSELRSFSEKNLQKRQSLNNISITSLEPDHGGKGISIITLSSTASEAQMIIKSIEGEQKKQVILSWMQTKIISDFLKVMMDNVSYLFFTYKEPNREKEFVEQMFLKSVYRSLPIQQVVQEDLLRYQVIYDDRMFWILPEGELSIPSGFYQ